MNTARTMQRWNQLIFSKCALLGVCNICDLRDKLYHSSICCTIYDINQFEQDVVYLGDWVCVSVCVFVLEAVLVDRKASETSGSGCTLERIPQIHIRFWFNANSHPEPLVRGQRFRSIDVLWFCGCVINAITSINIVFQELVIHFLH